tara:strand:- start:426 stop:1034 length:609 start_codon:yes stop_codon:yes gene_type:complete
MADVDFGNDIDDLRVEFTDEELNDKYVSKYVDFFKHNPRVVLGLNAAGKDLKSAAYAMERIREFNKPNRPLLKFAWKAWFTGVSLFPFGGIPFSGAFVVGSMMAAAAAGYSTHKSTRPGVPSYKKRFIYSFRQGFNEIFLPNKNTAQKEMIRKTDVFFNDFRSEMNKVSNDDSATFKVPEINYDYKLPQQRQCKIGSWTLKS